jgi:chemotaxis protein MotB
MITLLLVLFMVLYAISTVNQAKFKEFKQSVTNTKLFRTPHGTTNAATNSQATQATRLTSIEKALSGALRAKGLLQDVTFDMTSQGLVEGLVGDSTFFVSNSATLSATGYQIVDTSAAVLKSYNNAVEVAGYTDNRPISGGPFADNWALSAARAAAVVVRMSTSDGVNPTQLTLLGYGQYHPVASNSTPSGQAQNRRVNIVVSPTSKPVS